MIEKVLDFACRNAILTVEEPLNAGGTMRRKVLVLVGPVVVVPLGIFLLHHSRTRKLEELFSGPARAAQVSKLPYLPGYKYDLRAYERYTQERSYEALGIPSPPRIEPLSWPGGAAREEFEAMMRRRAEAVTGATAVLRLRSPSVYRERRPSPLLRITYPPDGAVFPPNLCTPEVEWEDPLDDIWQVKVGAGEREWTFVTHRRRWWFPEEVWEELKRVGGEIWVEVRGTRKDGSGPVYVSGRVHFSFAPCPADDFVVYRIVSPPFNPKKAPDMFVRDIRSFKEELFLSARRKYCFNCHTFSSKRGDEGKLALQVRYMAGGDYDLRVYLGIYDISSRKGWKVRLPFSIQMSTFVSWSPDGEKLAFSANQQLVTLHPVVFETQFAGEPTSDIAIYDLPENKAYLLPGASEPDLLEIYPRWTPNGDSLVFCSAPAGLHPAQVKYDLMVIPFEGGEPRPVPGASLNGRSNYYPRFSPDGRWLSFCTSDGGSLIKSSSDIYIMRSDLKGPPRRLESNVDYAADSWHSWSSNSRWLVFASKRDDGIYARLYFTYIDEEGHAHPAVRLPVKELLPASYNIPEFIAHRPPITDGNLYKAVRVEGPALSVQGG